MPRLTGNFPFWDHNLPKMMHLVSIGYVDFNKPVWNAVDKDAKNLLSELFNTDADLRPAANKCLDHPFFSAKRLALSALAISRMRKLVSKQADASNTKSMTNAGSSYSISFLRRIIDESALKIYSHWTGEHDKNKRVLLFQNSQKQLIHRSVRLR
ncbi:hypothetical protein HELRODRAFT_159557 [Helobdella robusta]|uniref:Protein kinase domain-containing protein n=1 Tax=Helobdella robusta TaxID=6412 RepID=T1EP57_HELRO|nr:hypothetical protein HELRODRAFT_159557 [Helobdella robusta]ESO12963.1 hypothetical protein HELRODRAFT_159557 [Helobdella robusta]